MKPKANARQKSNAPLEGTNPSGAPTLSVVIACLEAATTIDACLQAVQASCEGLAHETIVLHPSDQDLSDFIAANHPGVALIDAGSDALIPEMWARGFSLSSGKAVAFTTGHFVVSTGWARELLRAMVEGIAGAGGPIALRKGAGLVGRAVYFLRYSTFMPPMKGGVVREIAGDNAAYSRTSLLRHQETFANGFWEVEFHRLIRNDGEAVSRAPEAIAEVGRGYLFTTILKHRFEHGLRFGAYRTKTAGEPSWRVFLAAPLVPFVLAARIAARVVRKGQTGNFLLALPALIPLLGAWACGEALGAIGVYVDPELTSSSRGE